MVKFVCAKCNYRFEAKRKEDCPYCGGDSVEKEKDASEIVDDVVDLLEE